MNFADMSWGQASAFYVGLLLIAVGLTAFIIGLIREEKRRKRDLRQFDARVGRDVYRFIKGVHR